MDKEKPKQQENQNPTKAKTKTNRHNTNKQTNKSKQNKTTVGELGHWCTQFEQHLVWERAAYCHRIIHKHIEDTESTAHQEQADKMSRTTATNQNTHTHTHTHATLDDLGQRTSGG